MVFARQWDKVELDDSSKEKTTRENDVEDNGQRCSRTSVTPRLVGRSIFSAASQGMQAEGWGEIVTERQANPRGNSLGWEEESDKFIHHLGWLCT